jgi:hypothetical protein
VGHVESLTVAPTAGPVAVIALAELATAPASSIAAITTTIAPVSATSVAVLPIATARARRAAASTGNLVWTTGKISIAAVTIASPAITSTVTTIRLSAAIARTVTIPAAAAVEPCTAGDIAWPICVIQFAASVAVAI